MSKLRTVTASEEESEIFYFAKCEEMAKRVLGELRQRARNIYDRKGGPVLILDSDGEPIEEFLP